MSKRVFIIGGNGAGLSAASQIKRLKPKWEAIVLEKGPFISYASCGIPYYISGLVPEFQNLLHISPESAIKDRNIDLRLHHQVTAVNPEGKLLEVRVGDKTITEPFDTLLIATGAAPTTAGIKIKPSKRVFVLRGLKDAADLMDFIKREKPRSCAVIGGGYIAVEMLEAFQMRGLNTHLLHRREDLANTFEKELSDLIKKEMVKEGIILNLSTEVQALEEQKGKVNVITNKGELDFDFVLIAVGVSPNTSFIENSGILTGLKGSISVNKTLLTNYPYIYAAGDCAETTNIITGKPAYTPLALKANKEGYFAGINICGGNMEFPGIMETAITKFFNLGISRTGLSLKEAEKTFPKAIKYTFSSPSKAEYFPGMGPLHSIIIVNKEDGRILGAQLAGPVEAVKRIDVYASIIHNGMTLDEAFNLDLSYSPPYSPVFDPVLLAARIGKKYI